MIIVLDVSHYAYLQVKYIQEKGLAGAMVWEISQDDFADMCGDGKFPLVSILADMLDINRQSTSAQPATWNATLLIVTMLLTYILTRKWTVGHTC